MKHKTLLFSLCMMVASITVCYAQKNAENYEQTRLNWIKKNIKKENSLNTLNTLNEIIGAKSRCRTCTNEAEIKSKWLPLRETEYKMFDDGSSNKLHEIIYTYDERGNILTKLKVDTIGGSSEYYRTTYEYNACNMITSQLEEQSEDGMVYTKVCQYVYFYDPIVQTFVIRSGYYWMCNDEWTYAEDDIKYEVTRDDKGRVAVIEELSDWMGAPHVVSRNTITYDETTDMASSMLIENAMSDADTMQICSVLNIEWYKTDGQILATDFKSFFSGNNIIKSCVIEQSGYSPTIIKNELKDCGGHRVLMDAVPYEELTYTDNNGSYIYETNLPIDANENGVFDEYEYWPLQKEIRQFDNYGNETLIEYYSLNLFSDSETLELMPGDSFKYEYVYDEEKGVPIETLLYSYETEWDDETNTAINIGYVLDTKTVVNEFTSISDNSANMEQTIIETCEPVAIYTLSGTRTNEVQVGYVYIYLYPNGKTQKVIIK